MGIEYNAIWAQVRAEFECKHPETKITKFIASNNVTHFRKQCMTCGENIGAVAKARLGPRQQAEAPEFDKQLDEDWREKRSARQAELIEQAKDEEAEQWEQERTERAEAYGEYLLSSKWAAKRELVLKRDKYICQGCLRNDATQVHHLTYDHIGNEFLFELIAICVPCHRRFHAPKDASVNGVRN